MLSAEAKKTLLHSVVCLQCGLPAVMNKRTGMLASDFYLPWAPSLDMA